jgi:hypothetical protein
MKTLWGKIGLGALGVFGAGMLLITVVGDAKSAARSAVISALGAGIPEAAQANAAPDMPFRLAGDQLGLIRRMVVQRESSGAIPDVKLEVELSDPRFLARIRHCNLVPDGNNDFDFERGFQCESGPVEGYLSVGSVTFYPGHLTRPVMVLRKLESDLRDGDAFRATAQMDGDVRVTARGKDGKLVRIRADSSGANIRINDAVGRALLRLLADSNGASLRVRGKDGRDVVRMEAGQGGFVLTVDTTAAP